MNSIRAGRVQLGNNFGGKVETRGAERIVQLPNTRCAGNRRGNCRTSNQPGQRDLRLGYSEIRRSSVESFQDFESAFIEIAFDADTAGFPLQILLLTILAGQKTSGKT